MNLTDLPNSFDGFKIVQISDIHAGSFDNVEAVKRGIKKINALKPDLIVFTGDLVNHHYKEAEDWVEIFSALKAPYGKLSILGNHDYPMSYFRKGEENQWNHNLQQLENIHTRMGFKLLKNESTSVSINQEKIVFTGVENWGLPPFPQFGDLKKASHGIDNSTVNILLSHDPSHWDAEVRNFPVKYHLTLSGHTHGMQFGIEWGKLKWSPVKYK
jgi:predicted MPP superfamily phosphohydrolase